MNISSEELSDLLADDENESMVEVDPSYESEVDTGHSTPVSDYLDRMRSNADLLGDPSEPSESAAVVTADKPVKKPRKPRAKKEKPAAGSTSTGSTASSDSIDDLLADLPAIPSSSSATPSSAPAAPIPKRDAYDHLLESSNTPCIDQEHGKNWSMYRGDCVEVIKGILDESVHFSVYSPPFASLYVYSNSERDMGNARDYDEFGQHYAYLIHELHRVTKPGRLTAVHCMNLPTTKTHHGYIGIQDFRGDIIREHQKAGWIFHAETVIWKDPVTAMQRTKAIGLLHKQIVKDSCMSRMGIPDTVLFFRKDGVNPEPVEGEFDRWIGDDSFKQTGRLSIDVWQRFASPIWNDINANNTLQYMQARHGDDERHICPLQLDVIERCLELYSNENDVVLSPFGGIASEGYMSVLSHRKFIGIELKDTYWQAACKNLRVAETEAKNRSRKLFD